jgi:predicted membrane protein
MHHHWQDIVLAISILGFNLALIPTIFTKHKPHVTTGILTAVFQSSALVVFISLSLWYSAIMSFINAALWILIVVQKMNEPKLVRKKR